MKSIPLILIIPLAIVACQTAALSPQGSKRTVLEQVLAQHQDPVLGFQLRELPAGELQPWMLDPRLSHSVQRHYLPPGTQTADGFGHTVLLNIENQKYWIIRSGGYVGRIEVYGPAPLP